MKYRGIFEYEYPAEHKPPVSIDVHLHGDCVKGKIIEWEYRPLEQEPTTKNDLGVDAVSRKAVINQIFYSTDNNGDVVLGSALRERIARLPSVTPQEPFINKPCVSSGVCEHDKNKVLDKLDEIITDALDKSTDQKESQTLRWVLDKISEVVEDGTN